MTTNSPFCSPPTERILFEDELVIAIWDSFPVSPGHALLVPRRHIEDWVSASDDEQVAMTRAICKVQLAIEASHRPHGYNIGINSGEAAGQTVPHLHLHVIPRYRGDVSDPRGGVRWVMPDKADYWSRRE